MTLPVAGAVFQPQQWIFDNAVDSAPSVPFDAGPALLSLTVPQLAWAIEEAAKEFGGKDLDVVAEAAGLVKGVCGSTDGHDGPYCVDLEGSDVVAFLGAVGVDPGVDLTEDALEEARSRYREMGGVLPGDPVSAPRM